jgi:hypothetical protein
MVETFSAKGAIMRLELGSTLSCVCDIQFQPSGCCSPLMHDGETAVLSKQQVLCVVEGLWECRG